LSSQCRRAAVSFAANIAAGFSQRGNADQLRFLNLAPGSREASRYSLILAQDLDYGDVSELRTGQVEVSKLLEADSRAILFAGHSDS
jgi:four helix bundle protein